MLCETDPALEGGSSSGRLIFHGGFSCGFLIVVVLDLGLERDRSRRCRALLRRRRAHARDVRMCARLRRLAAANAWCARSGIRVCVG